MSQGFHHEPMLDMYIFETSQLLDELEQIVIHGEKENGLESHIHEMFRIMHTIKGSSAMMMYDNIAGVAHSLEDVFYYLREEKPPQNNFSDLVDIILEVLDFIKTEVTKIEKGKPSGETAEPILEKIRRFLGSLKEQNPNLRPTNDVKKEKETQSVPSKLYIAAAAMDRSVGSHHYIGHVHFEDDCGMFDVRAFSIVHQLKNYAEVIAHFPENLIDGSNAIPRIQADGLKIYFTSSHDQNELRSFFAKNGFIKSFTVAIPTLPEDTAVFQPKPQIKLDEPQTEPANPAKEETGTNGGKSGVISVKIDKLDMLMDLVGELVIAEAMVTQHPELEQMPIDGFHKAARQLRKISGELQDVAMSLRMVPLTATFQKMNRIIRDMSKKLRKDVRLEIIGDETEVDKNIIEHIGDPLMHIIRNAIDHGIESAETRLAGKKSAQGRITLEAKNTGGDVWIMVKDDGKGLDREKILNKALENGLVQKDPATLTDREIYAFIFSPGFSTKDKVTEFSGRGVGMDVVTKNVEMIGGMVDVDSAPGRGTTVTIKIPLTLAIVDGMNIQVGGSTYTIPTTEIKESFRPGSDDIVSDPDGNEMIMIRGVCYPILRLHRHYTIDTEITEFSHGILTMVEDNGKGLCLFSDALLGEQQVVVKALPSYLKKVPGIAGCTLLGSGEVSLIMDVAGLLGLYRS